MWLTGNSWGAVFLINVPIVIVGLVGILRVVPETRNPNPARLDLVGLVMSAVGLILVVYGIIDASVTKNWLAISVMVPIVVGLAILAVFIRMEARRSHRSFDVELFRTRGYSVSITAVSLSFFALSGITFTLPFYLQIIRGYDTLSAGLCFLPFAVGQLLAAPRSARMVERFGDRRVISAGLILVCLSLIGLAIITTTTPLWLLLVLFFAFGFGMGNVIAPASTVMQNVLPLARAGAGSAVQNTVRQVFGALGVAIIGTTLTTQYSARVAASLDLLPTQVPEAAKAAASQSLVATDALITRAVEMGLPPSIADTVRTGADDAFLQASHITTLIAAGIVAVAAVVVITLLKAPRAHATGS